MPNLKPTLTPMECLDCGVEFWWDFETVEPVDDDGEPCCDECGSYDVDLAAISAWVPHSFLRVGYEPRGTTPPER